MSPRPPTDRASGARRRRSEERRSRDLYQQRARIEFGDRHLLYRQGFVMLSDDGGATGLHDESFHSARLVIYLTAGTIGTFGTTGTIPIAPAVHRNRVIYSGSL